MPGEQRPRGRAGVGALQGWGTAAFGPNVPPPACWALSHLSTAWGWGGGDWLSNLSRKSSESAHQVFAGGLTECLGPGQGPGWGAGGRHWGQETEPYLLWSPCVFSTCGPFGGAQGRSSRAPAQPGLLTCQVLLWPFGSTLAPGALTPKGKRKCQPGSGVPWACLPDAPSRSYNLGRPGARAGGGLGE